MVYEAAREEGGQPVPAVEASPGAAERSRWLLAALLVLFLLGGFYYGRSFPPFEGPDEGQHFAYVTWLVAEGSFPPQGEAAWETAVQQEAGQPPLYYLLASIPARLTGLEPPAVYRPNPYFSGPFPRDNIDNDNRAIQYPEDGRPLRGGWLAFYLARGVSLLFGALLVGGVFLLGRAVWPERPGAALLAAALVAFTPQVLFVSSSVSNDVPAAALSTLVLWRLVVLVREGYTRGRALALGVLWGLAVLTKVSALALALPIGVGLLWRWWQERGMGMSFSLAAAVAWSGGSVVVTAGWWFLLNWQRYGTPLGLATHDRASWAVRSPADLMDPLARWPEVFRTYWAGLGWGTIRPPGWSYTVILLFVLLAMGGWALAWWEARPGRGRRVILPGLLALTVVAVVVLLEVWMRRVSAAHGRLLFPAAGAVAVLLVGGWRQWQRWLPLVPVTGLALLALVIPQWVVRPVYTPPEPLPASEVAALEPGLGWTFLEEGGRPVVEVLGVRPAESRVQLTAGEEVTLSVEVCWRALAQTERPVTLFVHLVGPEERVVAGRRTYPGLGLLPTTLWEAGSVVCDRVRVLILPKQVAETLAYQVEVGWLDAEADRRLVAQDSDGNVVGATFAGRVRLAAPGLETQPIESAEALPLLDYEVRPVWRRGETEMLTLTWGAATPVPVDYQTFVHLRDVESGEIVAQADGAPLDGWYGTSWWAAGEMVTDRRAFVVPAELEPGTYLLVVGFYELASGQRFGNEHVLGEIEVR